MLFLSKSMLWESVFVACILCFLACDGTLLQKKKKTVLTTTPSKKRVLTPKKKKTVSDLRGASKGVASERASKGEGPKGGGPKGGGPEGWRAEGRRGPKCRVFQFSATNFVHVELWPRFEAVAHPKFAFGLLWGHLCEKWQPTGSWRHESDSRFCDGHIACTTRSVLTKGVWMTVCNVVMLLSAVKVRQLAGQLAATRKRLVSDSRIKAARHEHLVGEK